VLVRSLAAAFAVLLGAGLSAPASAAPALDPAGGAQLKTLLNEAGLSVDEAQQRLGEESGAARLTSTLADALGGSFAGAWFERGSPDLVVATTDPAAAQRVREAGAIPRVVSLDLLTLNSVMDGLNARADSVPDAVTGWYVDPVSNAVVVSATDPGQAQQFAAGQPGVRIERVSTRPVPFADLNGGESIAASTPGASCSIGFSVASGSTRYVLTAGHCTTLGGTWYGSDGTPIGPVVRTSYPDDDFGLIEVTSPTWRQSGAVATSEGPVVMTGTAQAPVGASVCRSGATTGTHCGTVEAVNETVNYGGGEVVNGLTRTSTCAEPGDSGGPYFAGSHALGTLSGGSGSCFVSLFGAETFYQPIGEALSAYHVALVTGG
jgi:streptogrisin C